MAVRKPKIVFESSDFRVIEHPERGGSYNSNVGYIMEKSSGKDGMGTPRWEEIEISKKQPYHRSEPPIVEHKLLFQLCQKIAQQNGQIERLTPAEPDEAL